MCSLAGPQYSSLDKRVLRMNPELKGARTKAKQMIQESQQDSEAKMMVENFI